MSEERASIDPQLWITQTMTSTINEETPDPKAAATTLEAQMIEDTADQQCTEAESNDPLFMQTQMSTIVEDTEKEKAEPKMLEAKIIEDTTSQQCTEQVGGSIDARFLLMQTQMFAMIKGTTAEIEKLKAKMIENAANSEAEMTALKANSKAEIEKLKAKMIEDTANSEAEMTALKTNSKAEIENLKAKMIEDTAISEAEMTAKFEEELTVLKEDSVLMKKTLKALVIDRGMSVAVQSLLYATRDQPREMLEESRGACHFVSALSNKELNNALDSVFKLEDAQQKLDKYRTWDDLYKTRNSKEHANTLDELRGQAELVKENLVLLSDGMEDDSQQNIILEIVNNLSPLSKAVPNFGVPIRPKNKRNLAGEGSATPSPLKSTRTNKSSPAKNRP